MIKQLYIYAHDFRPTVTALSVEPSMPSVEPSMPR